MEEAAMFVHGLVRASRAGPLAPETLSTQAESQLSPYNGSFAHITSAEHPMATIKSIQTPSPVKINWFGRKFIQAADKETGELAWKTVRCNLEDEAIAILEVFVAKNVLDTFGVEKIRTSGERQASRLGHEVTEWHEPFESNRQPGTYRIECCLWFVGSWGNWYGLLARKKCNRKAGEADAPIPAFAVAGLIGKGYVGDSVCGF